MSEGPDVVESCPAWSGDRYSIVFQSETGSTLATVLRYVDSCFGISIHVTGTATIPLSDPNDSLLNSLEAFVPPSGKGHGARQLTTAP